MSDDLKDLETKLNAARGEKKEKSELQKTIGAGVEFTTPMIGGMLIGYGLDRWLDTAPAFIISLFLLGVGAGVLNIYKASQNIGGTIGFSELHSEKKNAKTLPSNDSDDAESSADKE